MTTFPRFVRSGSTLLKRGWQAAEGTLRALIGSSMLGSTTNKGCVPDESTLRRNLLYATTRMARHHGIEATVLELKTLVFALNSTNSPIRLVVQDLREEAK